MDKNLLYKYFSRQATDEERSQIRQWADASPENLHQFMKERALFDAMTVLADDVEAKPAGGRIRRIALSLSKIAAVAVVTLILSHFIRVTYFPLEIPMQELTVPAGQQLNLTLADGTNVWLNSKTKLRYPAIFNGSERRVEIDGEGYFRVTKNAEMPFRVETSRGEIEVLGTTFDVEAYSSDNSFNTSLIDGAVKIQADGRSCRLVPGQTASVDASGKIHISNIDNYDEFRWTEGIISLKNDSFKEIMKKFEKCYGVTISIENSRIGDVAYSGKFYQVDGVQYALKVLQHDIDFKYKSDKENQIIYIK